MEASRSERLRGGEEATLGKRKDHLTHYQDNIKGRWSDLAGASNPKAKKSSFIIMKNLGVRKKTYYS